MVNIIIKNKKSTRGTTPNQHAQKWSRKASKQYNGVHRENKEEFRKEKMVQELSTQGFNEAAISGMTTLSESSVKTMIKSKGNIHLDGNY